MQIAYTFEAYIWGKCSRELFHWNALVESREEITGVVQGNVHGICLDPKMDIAEYCTTDGWLFNLIYQKKFIFYWMLNLSKLHRTKCYSVALLTHNEKV